MSKDSVELQFDLPVRPKILFDDSSAQGGAGHEVQGKIKKKITHLIWKNINFRAPFATMAHIRQEKIISSSLLFLFAGENECFNFLEKTATFALLS